jgi:ubiquinone/menaquinone biosynthesis C-methylase UbiE
MRLNREWEKASRTFNAYKSKVDASAADNIEIAWPAVLKFIKNKKGRTLSALDFGCGVGAFCNRLHKLGFKAVGIDFSRKMIENARKHSPKSVKYLVGSRRELTKMRTASFDVITSIMVFQFIADAADYARTLARILKQNGVLVLVVVNPEFARRCNRTGIRYFRLPKNGFGKAEFKLAGLEIPVFIRSKGDYAKMLEKNGLKLASADYPRFTRAFLEKHDWRLPSDEPEFMVLAFKK